MAADNSSRWYELADPDPIDSPALLVYPGRLDANINDLLSLSGSPDRLRPHVKTHKMAAVVERHLQRGIRQFKCATIAEAEMIAAAGAAGVLLAYQPAGPRLTRLLALAGAYPAVTFGCLVDEAPTLRRISAAAAAAGHALEIWVDIDSGMGRTGIPPGPAALALYRLVAGLPGVRPAGLHAYDGHIHQTDFEARRSAAETALAPVLALRDQITAAGLPAPAVIAGGTPSFPVHARRADLLLSPGTYVFWDAVSLERTPDLPFRPAALLLARVISRPGPDRLCLDIGHTAVGSENPLDRRVRFLNEPEAAACGQSEEHLVVSVADADRHTVGDVWYALPWHICPTVALHQEALVVQDGQITGTWPVTARDRRMTV